MLNRFDDKENTMNIQIPEDSENINVNGFREASMQLEDYKGSVGLNGNAEYFAGYEAQNSDPEVAFNTVPLTGYVMAKDKQEELKSLDDFHKISVATVMQGYQSHLEQLMTLSEGIEDTYDTVTEIRGIAKDDELVEAVDELQTQKPLISVNLVGEPVRLRYSWRCATEQKEFEVEVDGDHHESHKANGAAYADQLDDFTDVEVKYVSDAEKHQSRKSLSEMLEPDIDFQMEFAEEEQAAEEQTQNIDEK